MKNIDPNNVMVLLIITLSVLIGIGFVVWPKLIDHLQSIRNSLEIMAGLKTPEDLAARPSVSEALQGIRFEITPDGIKGEVPVNALSGPGWQEHSFTRKAPPPANPPSGGPSVQYRVEYPDNINPEVLRRIVEGAVTPTTARKKTAPGKVSVADKENPPATLLQAIKGGTNRMYRVAMVPFASGKYKAMNWDTFVACFPTRAISGVWSDEATVLAHVSLAGMKPEDFLIEAEGAFVYRGIFVPDNAAQWEALKGQRAERERRRWQEIENPPGDPATTEDFYQVADLLKRREDLVEKERLRGQQVFDAGMGVRVPEGQPVPHTTRTGGTVYYPEYRPFALRFPPAFVLQCEYVPDYGGVPVHPTKNILRVVLVTANDAVHIMTWADFRREFPEAAIFGIETTMQVVKEYAALAHVKPSFFLVPEHGSFIYVGMWEPEPDKDGEAWRQVLPGPAPMGWPTEEEWKKAAQADPNGAIIHAADLPGAQGPTGSPPYYWRGEWQETELYQVKDGLADAVRHKGVEYFLVVNSSKGFAPDSHAEQWVRFTEKPDISALEPARSEVDTEQPEPPAPDPKGGLLPPLPPSPGQPLP